MPSRHDALVVGGGPAGSALAIRLARQGRDVVLIDRGAFPRTKPCSEYGSPGTLAELALLGFDPASMADRWARLAGTRVTAARGSSLLGRFAELGPASGMALPRRELDARLIELARDAGATVLERHRLVELQRDPDGTMRALTDGPAGPTPFRARVVAGADGLRSRVARATGLHRQGPLRRIAIVARMGGVRAMGDGAELHVGRAGYVGLNPLGGGITNVALVIPAHRAESLRGDPADFLARELSWDPRLGRRVAGAVHTEPVQVTGPFDSGCRRSTADGVVLVGDAAGFFDPFTGEGICAALIGARLAAPVVDAALALPGPVTAARLAPYRRARLAAFAGKWTVERLIGYAMLRPALFDRFVARIGRRGMASTLIGVTGHVLPARRALNPIFLAKAAW